MAGLVIPVSGLTAKNVKSSFGAARDGGHRKHKGVDLFAKTGTPVIAARGGKVVKVSHGGNKTKGGNSLWIHGDDGRFYYYAHFQGISVKNGQQVKAGEVLGGVGNSGSQAQHTSPHLHFSVNSKVGNEDAAYGDPAALLLGASTKTAAAPTSQTSTSTGKGATAPPVETPLAGQTATNFDYDGFDAAARGLARATAVAYGMDEDILYDGFLNLGRSMINRITESQNTAAPPQLPSGLQDTLTSLEDVLGALPPSVLDQAQLQPIATATTERRMV